MAGRPAAIIDWKEVGQLLEADCTATSIAARLGISTDTLYRRCQTDNKIDFAAFSQQKKESGEALLRKQQFALAMKGNLGMLIWLGKQRLGQKDKAAHEHSGKDGGPLPVPELRIYTGAPPLRHAENEVDDHV